MDHRRYCKAALAGIAAIALASLSSAAVAQWEGKGLAPSANTQDPAAPFHIDLAGVDMASWPPVHDPRTPGFPAAVDLPDGTLPPAGATGNFIIGPSHAPAPETVARAGVPRGRLLTFTMHSAESTIYRPGIAREERGFNQSVFAAATAPGDPSQLLVTTSRAGTWTRIVRVYVPAQVRRGKPAPLLVIGDGDVARDGGQFYATVLDNLIAARRIAPMVAVMIGSGGQDAQGSERGREYDTVSGTYAQWVESEVLPRVEREAGVALSRDPDQRAAMGISSSGVAAFTMAWFRPDLYHRVIAWSPTFVNQQWPRDPALPGGAWQYHSPWAGVAPAPLDSGGFLHTGPARGPLGTPLIPASPRKPIRFWFSVGDRDLFYPVGQMADGMHDWVLANERVAAALAAKGYAYQFLFARKARHADQDLIAQTLPAALEWVWAGQRVP
ncbi:alpha/beta hydrolase [Novosphingobium bradum]|uniref:Alpha/beta hydrolase n=1 Tax=Novosphingobium bradum TaxID=1737444 RepID=A0ABV7IRD2_9SPHN